MGYQVSVDGILKIDKKETRIFSIFLKFLIFENVNDIYTCRYEKSTWGISLFLSVFQLSGQAGDSWAREKLYVHTDRANYLQGDTVWFRAYLMNTNRERDDYSHFIYAELLKDSLVISRQTITDNQGLFSGYIPLADTLRSGSYNLRFYTRHLATLPQPSYFYRQIILGGNSFHQYRKTLTNRGHVPFHVSFFPEGGSLPLGSTTRIAFKALNPDGLGTDVSGVVVNRGGDTLAILGSVHRGMGVFTLKPIAGESYTAVFRNRKGQELRFPLPEADASAASLRVDVRKEAFLVRVIGKSLPIPDRGYALRVEYRDRVFFRTDLTASAPLLLNRSLFPPGVLRLVLLDSSGVPLSGRTVFNQQQVEVPANLDLSATCKEKKGKSFWDIRLALYDASREALSGSLSVSITDDRYAIQDTTVNILSSFLLTSDLKGYVENPAFYFDGKDPYSAYKLDLLMLTQGWVNYHVEPKEVVTTEKQIGGELCVSGRVVSEYSAKKYIPNATVTLISFDKKIIRQTTSDVLGHFYFDSLYFPQDTYFVIQATKQKGRAEVALQMDSAWVPMVQYMPPLYADWLRAEVEFQDTPKPVEDKNGKENGWHPVFKEGVAMERQLNEVVISARKVEEKKRYLIESSPYHSDWNKVYHVDEMTFSPYASVKDLLIHTPGVAWGVDPNTGEEGFYITRLGSRALLLINGLEATYSELVSMPIQLIESVELVKDVAQMTCIGPKALGGVIMVSIKAGGDIPLEKASNFRVIRPQGYQVKREFYAPFYPFADGEREKVGKKEKTIGWFPDVWLDKKASHLQVKAPEEGSLTVVVQGVTSNGKLVNFVRRLEPEQ